MEVLNQESKEKIKNSENKPRRNSFSKNFYRLKIFQQMTIMVLFKVQEI